MDIINKLIKAIFPVVLVLLVLSCFNWGKIKNSPAKRFLVICCSLILILRIIMFLAGVKIASRYFYGLSIITICFAAPGVVLLSDWLKQIIKLKYPKFSSKYAIVVILIICSAICIGKALRFKMGSKKWITETAKIVRENSKGRKKIIVSNNPDQRVSYYASAEFIRFLIPGNEKTYEFDEDGNSERINPEFGMLGKSGERLYAGCWQLLPDSMGVENFEKILNNMDGNVFVLMRMKDDDFRMKFAEQGIPFPLKLIKTMRDDKKREICLYVLK